MMRMKSFGLAVEYSNIARLTRAPITIPWLNPRKRQQKKLTNKGIMSSSVDEEKNNYFSNFLITGVHTSRSPNVFHYSYLNHENYRTNYDPC